MPTGHQPPALPSLLPITYLCSSHTVSPQHPGSSLGKARAFSANQARRSRRNLRPGSGEFCRSPTADVTPTLRLRHTLLHA
eukprot:357001-Chlamydomonas_euryale.AAC.14